MSFSSRNEEGDDFETRYDIPVDREYHIVLTEGQTDQASPFPHDFIWAIFEDEEFPLFYSLKERRKPRFPSPVLNPVNERFDLEAFRSYGIMTLGKLFAGEISLLILESFLNSSSKRCDLQTSICLSVWNHPAGRNFLRENRPLF